MGIQMFLLLINDQLKIMLNAGTHKKLRLVKASINIPLAIQIGKWISRNITALIIISFMGKA